MRQMTKRHELPLVLFLNYFLRFNTTPGLKTLPAGALVTMRCDMAGNAPSYPASLHLRSTPNFLIINFSLY